MTKDIYIMELRKRLSVLDSKEVDNILIEYLDYFKQKEKDGISEGLAIEQLGNVNVLARDILKSYKIAENYIKLFIGKEKLIDEVNEFVNKVADTTSTVYIKIEETVTDFARTTGHIAKNVYKETIKFGEQKVKNIKKVLKKNKPKNDSDNDIIDTDEVKE